MLESTKCEYMHLFELYVCLYVLEDVLFTYYIKYMIYIQKIYSRITQT